MSTAVPVDLPLMRMSRPTPFMVQTPSSVALQGSAESITKVVRYT